MVNLKVSIILDQVLIAKGFLEHTFGTSSKFDSSGKVLFAVEGVVFLVNQKEMSA
jgi:hypothetical protein